MRKSVKAMTYKQRNLPKVITHKNRKRYADRLAREAEKGKLTTFDDPRWWGNREAILEFPLGELCKDAFSTIALMDKDLPEPMALTGKEGFDAQGLEGKCQVRMPLYVAITRLPLLAERRGRILTILNTPPGGHD